jgi:GNAT superfamily N-acetyltransferase
MPAYPITLSDVVDSAAEAAIGGGLNQFNDGVLGYGDRRPLAVTVRDPATDAIVGGAIGRTSLGLLFIDLFFLPEALRGAGLGTRVLQLCEEEARRRGCRSAVLYTISFQAPGFYERNGWHRFGEVACDPPGTSRVFLSKAL